MHMTIVEIYFTLEGNVVSSLESSDTLASVLVEAPKDGVIPRYTCNIVCDCFSNISDEVANSTIELSFSTDPVNFEVLCEYEFSILHS